MEAKQKEDKNMSEEKRARENKSVDKERGRERVRKSQ